jgi:hypothetical protein
MSGNPDRTTFEYNVPPISDDQLYDLEVSVDETHSFGLFVRHDFYAIMARLRAAEAKRDRLREALKPFAAEQVVYNRLSGGLWSADRHVDSDSIVAVLMVLEYKGDCFFAKPLILRVGDLQAAHAALKPGQAADNLVEGGE